MHVKLVALAISLFIAHPLFGAAEETLHRFSSEGLLTDYLETNPEAERVHKSLLWALSPEDARDDKSVSGIIETEKNEMFKFEPQ